MLKSTNEWDLFKNLFHFEAYAPRSRWHTKQWLHSKLPLSGSTLTYIEQTNMKLLMAHVILSMDNIVVINLAENGRKKI